MEFPTFIVGQRDVLCKLPLYIATIEDTSILTTSDESEEEVEEHAAKRMRTELGTGVDSNEIPLDEEEDDESFIKELEVLATSDIESLRKIIADEQAGDESGCVS